MNSTEIIQLVINRDWAEMLKLFPEGILYRGNISKPTLEDLEDWDTYDTFARYCYPIREALIDNCLNFKIKI